MGLGQNLWGTYLDRFGPPRETTEVEEVPSSELLKLIWPFLTKFRSPSLMVGNAKPVLGFEIEADKALQLLAERGEVSVWDDLSAGVWTELLDRFKFSIAALSLEEKAGNFTLPLPVSAESGVRAMAALLYLLGGPGRDRPSNWKNISGQEQPEVPENWPLTRQ